MTCLGIDRRKQGELVAVLFDHSLVHQDDCRQVGGWSATGFLKALTELLDPLPDRHVRALNADSAENLLDFAEAHSVVVEEDR